MSPLVGLELQIQSLYEEYGPTHQRVWFSKVIRAGSTPDISLYPTYHSPALPMIYGDLSPVKAKEVFQHWTGHQPTNGLRSLLHGILATANIYSTSARAANAAVYNAIRLLHTQAAVPKDVLILLVHKWCSTHPNSPSASGTRLLLDKLKYDSTWDW